MLKIEDLIADSEWLPNELSTYSKKPKLSILLPVYNAISTSLFASVLESILLQQDIDFELIIVDDNSTDGTKEYVLGCMKKDPRIHLIAHKKNINIFAIHVFCSYEKSQGEFFIIASQNFIFSKSSFENLCHEAESKPYSVISGSVQMQIGAEPKKTIKSFRFDALNTDNILIPSAFIIPRTVLEDVGLYDPLLLNSHYCKWDLWSRISFQCPLFQIDNLVGWEISGSYPAFPVATSVSGEVPAFFKPDPLENIPINLYYAKRIMGLDRNKILSPKTFSKMKLIRKLTGTVGQELYSYVQFLESALKDKFENNSLEEELRKDHLPERKKILIISALTASAVLPFWGLKDSEEFEITYANIFTQVDLIHLTTVELVIIIRDLFNAQSLIKRLNQLNIPWTYFIDDNFTLLSQEKQAVPRWYNHKNLQSHLASATAVLTSTKPLQEYYEKHQLHHNVCIFPPIISKAMVKILNHNHLLSQYRVGSVKRLHVAMIGGAFRQKSFLKNVLPALVRLSQLINITLWTSCNIDSALKIPNRLSIRKIPLEENYIQFILKLNSMGIDIIVHPHGKTNNLVYKTDSIVLTARYLQANILVANEPCFKDLNESKGILKMDDTEDDAYQKLLSLLNGTTREKLLDALIKHADNYYASDTSRNILKKLLEEKGDFSAFEIERRFSVMATCFYRPQQSMVRMILKQFQLNGVYWVLGAGLRYGKRYFKMKKIKIPLPVLSLRRTNNA